MEAAGIEPAGFKHGSVGLTHASSVHRGELVLVDVSLDLAAEFRGLHVGRTEVNPGPEAGFEHLSRSENRLKVRCSSGNRPLVA